MVTVDGTAASVVSLEVKVTLRALVVSVFRVTVAVVPPPFSAMPAALKDSVSSGAGGGGSPGPTTLKTSPSKKSTTYRLPAASSPNDDIPRISP